MPSTSETDWRVAPAKTIPRRAGVPHIVGRHFVAEIHGCPRARLATLQALEAPFLRAVAATGACILSHDGHQFAPHGATIVALLSESHASVHTWPELGYAAVDFFTCNRGMDAEPALRGFAAALGATSVDVRVIDRGTIR